MAPGGAPPLSDVAKGALAPHLERIALNSPPEDIYEQMKPGRFSVHHLFKNILGGRCRKAPWGA
ncbi:MAG: hypothetical protein LBE86_15595, partial [Gemmobacter sp.]|nr:hypothetical protein [Gemmobacter sp.]